MAKKRTHKKTKRTTADQARLIAKRKDFQSKRASLSDLVGSGDYVESTTQRAYLEAKLIARMLKQAREEAQMTLAEVSDATGMDRSAISRLENGIYPNTSINTLNRLASAYGKRCVLCLEDAPG